MTNKYAGNCVYCGARVPARGGNLFKKDGRWVVAHLACGDAESPQVIEYYSPSTGFRGTRNAKGRCEDAPCCGCCDF